MRSSCSRQLLQNDSMKDENDLFMGQNDESLKHTQQESLCTRLEYFVDGKIVVALFPKIKIDNEILPLVRRILAESYIKRTDKAT